MKKLLALLLTIVLAAGLAGCTGEIITTELDGPYVTDTYEITAPEGWVMAESSGNIIFMKADYPQTQSYIMVGKSDQKQVDQLLENKEAIIENVKKELTEKHGEEAKPEISVFEETKIDGVRCVKTQLDYTEGGMKVQQVQYSVDMGEGSAAFTFTTVGDEDFSEAFEKAAASIKLQ